jgi:hypothetical protein
MVDKNYKIPDIQPTLRKVRFNFLDGNVTLQYSLDCWEHVSPIDLKFQEDQDTNDDGTDENGRVEVKVKHDNTSLKIVLLGRSETEASGTK